MRQKRLFLGFLENGMPMEYKIDLVMPYVDNTDPIWIKQFNKYSSSQIDENTNGKTRFRGQGSFFKYVFRGIDKFMPWINNVYLIVQSDSQVPDWINKDKVKIITHDKFIPHKYLPTYNSCTIEMFLWNIPGLSEHFIYINDDFYATNYLLPTDFFENNKVKQNIKMTSNMSIYGKQCQNCHELIYGDRPIKYKTISHSFRPYLKSEMQKCFMAKNEKILSSVTRFRDFKNYNCYIYSLYQDRQGLRIDSSITDTYLSAAQVSSLCRTNIDFRLKCDTLCINDNDPKINVYENYSLNEWFYKEFPKTCKYENGGSAYKEHERTHSMDTKPKYFLYF